MVHHREAWADRVDGGGAPHRRAAVRGRAPYLGRGNAIFRDALPASLPSRGLPDFGVKLLSKAPCQGVFETSNMKRNGLI
jgi:hypothetical protein